LNPNEWWPAVEAGHAPGAPAWLDSLRRAHDAEIAFHPEQTLRFLDGLDLKGPWPFVAGLLAHRAAVRMGDRLTLRIAPIEEFIASIPGEETETLARARWLRGTLGIRLNQYDRAFSELRRALGLTKSDTARIRLLDSIGQVYRGMGAWIEAERILRSVLARKRADHDIIGVAITSGNLALLELQRGNHAAARDTALAGLDDSLAPISRLRLLTIAEEAAPEKSQAALEELLEQTGKAGGRLRGYACVVLARAGQGDTAAWLDRAQGEFTEAYQQDLVVYWRAKLLDQPAAPPPDGDLSQAAFKTHLLLAERGDTSHLDHAVDIATRANEQAWIEEADTLYAHLEPERFRERLVERFSGGEFKDLHKTSREEVTIIFSDLVGFTPRSLEMEPEEVLETARSLFQNAVPLMTRDRVRPLQHQGDGLLAMARGPGHRERAIRYACDLVRRGEQLTEVRMAAGERWGLRMRAGVASGPVTLGLLGSLYKLEYLAIGQTTNLAARLQGQAEPGEVVVDDPQGQEQLALKGFDKSVRITRHLRRSLG